MKRKLPIWVWIVGLILALWNIMGLYSFAHDYAMTPADIAKLPPNQAGMYTGMAGWEWVVYGVGTVCGLLGTLSLLLKQRWAEWLSLISFIMVLIQFSNAFLTRNAQGHWESGAIFFVGFIAVISAAQYALCRHASKKGWIG